MSDITKQSLTELVENIKNKKLSSTDVTKAKGRRPSWKLICHGNLKQEILRTSSCKLSPLFESNKYAQFENDCKSYIST